MIDTSCQIQIYLFKIYYISNTLQEILYQRQTVQDEKKSKTPLDTFKQVDYRVGHG